MHKISALPTDQVHKPFATVRWTDMVSRRNGRFPMVQ